MNDIEHAMQGEHEEPQVLMVRPEHYRVFSILTASTLVFFFMLCFGVMIIIQSVLPMFVSLFEGMNLTLPLPTKIVIMFFKGIRPFGGCLFLMGSAAAALVLVIIITKISMERARKDFLKTLLIQLTAYLGLQFLFLAFLSFLFSSIFVPFYTILGTLH